MNNETYKSLIFRSGGGGLKVDNHTVIQRTRLFVSRKLKKNMRSLTQDEREIICSVLKEVFDFPVYKILDIVPWSSSTVYNDIKNGEWKNRCLKPTHSFHTKRSEFISYLLYNQKYLP